MKPRRAARRPDYARRVNPQLALRFEASDPVANVRWGHGMSFTCLGRCLTLRLDTPCHEATLLGEVLHLPLPPGAVARQIQDAVEAWLRQEARRVIGALLESTAQHLGCRVPDWAFSFSTQADWVQQHDNGSLRFNWRLIEQSPGFIEQTVVVAVERMASNGAGAGMTADLWSMPEG
ncbi:MAG: DUF45 domain-containing protein [Sterolibacterium sp.]|jgi:predicted metal-dependent hydrolase|nr:DUF45 domain-containing protein [Sterolibacterium sp.]